jgi:hypothetical protein
MVEKGKRKESCVLVTLCKHKLHHKLCPQLAQGVVGFILEVIGKMFSETKAQVHSSFMIYIVI